MDPRTLLAHADPIAARLVEVAERLEDTGEPLLVLDALALRNIARLLSPCRETP
jgi:hypothetical protein